MSIGSVTHTLVIGSEIEGARTGEFGSTITVEGVIFATGHLADPNDLTVTVLSVSADHSVEVIDHNPPHVDDLSAAFFPEADWPATVTDANPSQSDSASGVWSEFNIFRELHRQELVRLKIEDGEGVMQDYSDFLDTDWVNAVRLIRDREQFSARLEIELFREVNGVSLAPLKTSPANELAAALKRRRRITMETALLPPGEAVQEGNWQLQFDGRVDDPEWGGDEPIIEVTARDQAGVLHDTWIEEERAYGSFEDPVPIQNVIQSLLDDTMGVEAPQIVTLGNPDFGIVEYNQRRMSLEQAIRNLINQMGWDFRYRWHSPSDSFRFVLSNPPRQKTNPDAFFGSTDYESIEEVKIVGEDTRNVGIVIFNDPDGNEQTGIAEQPDSIEDFGRRVIVIDSRQDGLIIGEPAAQTLATVVVGDLAQPPVQHIARQAFYPAELDHVYEYEPNERYYDAPQKVAPHSIVHEFSRAEDGGLTIRTTITGRTQPNGGRMRWFYEASKSSTRRDLHVPSPSDFDIPDPEPFGQISVLANASGDISVTASGNSVVQSWKFFADTTRPSDEDVRGATAINGQSLSSDEVGTLFSGLDPGETVFVSAFAYTQVDGGGTESVRIDASGTFGSSADGIAPGSITADKLTTQGQRFSTNIEFFSNNPTSIGWTGGFIRLANGDEFEVGGISSLTVFGITYIFFSPSVPTSLQVTSNWSTVASDNVILMAVAKPAVSGGSAFVVPGVGTMHLSADQLTPASVTETKIANDSISTPKLRSNSISAAKIQSGAIQTAHLEAGAITAGKIAANAVTAAKIDVVSLSAISADLGTVTAGVIQSGIIVASDSFTASNAVFEGTSEYQNNHGSWRVRIISEGSQRGALHMRAGFGSTSVIRGGLSVLELEETNIRLRSSNEVESFANRFIARSTSGSFRFMVDNPPSGTPNYSSLTLIFNNAGTVVSRPVRVDGTDSAGSGWRRLIVQN